MQHRFPAGATLRGLSLVLCLLIPTAAAAAPDGLSHGVYVRLGHAAPGSVVAIVDGLENELAMAGWRVLSSGAVGVPAEDCGYPAHVLVADSPEHTEPLLRRGKLAAFALPHRLAVWEDEEGVHIAAANALSLTRTMVAEEGFETQARAAMQSLADVVSRAEGVQSTFREYGQMRQRGLIAKTMGIMAGGPFPDKVERLARVRDDDAASVAARLASGFDELANDWRWKIGTAYTVDYPDHGVSIVGLSGAPVEARSFEIVGAGADAARDEFACPGLAHAAAYPLELVVAQQGDDVEVLLIDVMFRMKVYFEDAGKMAFAMNMRMPGAIEDEIRDKVDASLR